MIRCEVDSHQVFPSSMVGQSSESLVLNEQHNNTCNRQGVVVTIYQVNGSSQTRVISLANKLFLG